MQVYLRSTTGTSIKSAKGEVELTVKLNDLLAVLEDTATFPHWLYQCKYATTIKQPSVIERYDYILTDMPWPNWDRDVVVRSVFQQDLRSKQVTISFDSAPDLVALKPGVVRIRRMTGNMRITPLTQGRLKLVYEVNVDPGGRIPKWLVNDLVLDFPFFSLKNLREFLQTKPNK